MVVGHIYRTNVDLEVDFMERHLLGSRHSKNPCDGEDGIMKQSNH